MEKKYLLVFFDSKKTAFFNNAKLIEDCINELWRNTYKNQSIKLSLNTLLIRVFADDLDNFPYPKNHIEDVFSNIPTNGDIVEELKTMNTYILPVTLKSIEDQTIGFEKEIAFLENIKEK